MSYKKPQLSINGLYVCFWFAEPKHVYQYVRPLITWTSGTVFLWGRNLYYFGAFVYVNKDTTTFFFYLTAPALERSTRWLCCDRWKTCFVTLSGIIFSLCRMQCGQFHAMKDHSHLSSIPILPVSSWCAAAQTLPLSQLLGRKRRRRRRRRKRRRRGKKGSGECSLKKSWIGAIAASCPSLSSPAVHIEYSNHK